MISPGCAQLLPTGEDSRVPLCPRRVRRWDNDEPRAPLECHKGAGEKCTHNLSVIDGHTVTLYICLMDNEVKIYDTCGPIGKAEA